MEINVVILLLDWLLDCLVDWLVGHLVCWLVGWVIWLSTLYSRNLILLIFWFGTSKPLPLLATFSNHSSTFALDLSFSTVFSISTFDSFLEKSLLFQSFSTCFLWKSQCSIQYFLLKSRFFDHCFPRPVGNFSLEISPVEACTQTSHPKYFHGVQPLTTVSTRPSSIVEQFMYVYVGTNHCTSETVRTNKSLFSSYCFSDLLAYDMPKTQFEHTQYEAHCES